MASTFDADLDEGYQNTNTYREASPERRRQLNRYKKELNISDEHMFLLLFKQDLESVPESERTGGDTAANAMIVVGFLLLWSTLQGGMNAPGGPNVLMIFLGLASFCLVAYIYYKGILNPYKRAVRETNKRLKKQPEVMDFTDWDLQNPGKVDRKAAKSAKKKRR